MDCQQTEAAEIRLGLFTSQNFWVCRGSWQQHKLRLFILQLWKTSSGGFAHNKCIESLERMPVDAKLICRPSYGCSSPSFLLRMKWEITASGRTSLYVPSKRERPPNFTKPSSQTSLHPLVMSQPTQKQTLSQQKKTALKQRYPRSEIMVRPQSATEDSAKKNSASNSHKPGLIVVF